MNHGKPVFELPPDDPRVKALASADPRMGRLIALIGSLATKPQGPLFTELARSIISQQISVKAASTIRGRVIELAGELSPAALLAQSDADLRAAGLSASKVAYLKDLSDKVQSGQLDLDRLQELDDEEVIKQLVSVKGIGRWSAEMFLIFALGREHVVSYGDAGLQRAAKWVYDMEERPDRKYLQQAAAQWPSYGSIASLYLWEAINRGHVDSGETFSEQLTSFGIQTD
ncbi:DNA-3-methyladenine glycosylase [Paenibacillus sp. p3-SID1389]|uniref:DNA-3-methyladenine glycosylase family protein n=1 Tax=Paenibacillus sp. p3-SID1389 TaxID=2916364 RepID=UPI0021A27297|nr:DNA-3-methyladenine glycosylase [Paenibacillus sp. p3-SID1389]MCT2195726.1 DNA-3-methyladenine glycosylase [Paenibacillus sp. p3-SID1389]